MEEKSYFGVDADDLYRDLTGWTRGNIREQVEVCCCPFCLSDLCVSVYVTVEEKDDVVIWRDFENPAQLCEYPDVYKKFGPFEFEKKQYKDALSNFGMVKYHW